MKKHFFPIFSLLYLLPMMETKMMAQNKTLTYPTTHKKEVIDTYFDQKIADPYRWLEDDRSEETASWVAEQNKVTFEYLNQITYREQIKKRMEQLWNYERIGAPFTEGGTTYYYKNNGLQNQSVLYRKVNGIEEVFLDPNTLSKDGTTSLANVSFSKDGSLCAYSISKGGSDWNEIIILDAKTKKVLDVTIRDVKFSGISWRGNEGFYYSSYDKPKGSELSAKTDQHKLYFHKMGTSQAQDQVIFGAETKRRYVGGYVTQDQKYLVITAANSTSGNELYVLDLSKKDAKMVQLVEGFDHDFSVLDHAEGSLLVETNWKAPNSQVILIDPTGSNKEWKILVPQTDFVLNATTGAGYLFANYLKDAISLVKQLDYKGKVIREIALPGVGSAGGFSAKKTDKEIYFSFTNYTTPTSIFKLNPNLGTVALYQQPKIDFNPEDYVSKQVFYASKDGTKIPMIITHKKGLEWNGKNPTILYGYGGFNVNSTPGFSVTNAVWMENGGVYAVANIRGGGEYGKKWHDAGTQMQKQNVFDDFIAAAEYLIQTNITSKEFLAIKGGSNGGLLVGACMTQRPDLFQVALPAVGVLDMLRYHTFTAGAGWAYDYGTSEQSKEMFQYLLGYSPVHNVKKGIKYPATLITTADHDDRVVPAHSFKFAAELQDKQTGNAPVLIRIDVNAGHGAGKPISKTMEENADIQAFTLFNMGVQKLP